MSSPGKKEKTTEVVNPLDSQFAVPAPVSDDDLEIMQDELFGRKEETSPEERKGRVNGAVQEIIEKTQELNKSQPKKQKAISKEEETETEETKFDGTFPEFDASKFLEGAEDKEEGEDESDEDEEEIEGETAAGEEESSPSFTKETNIKNLRQVAGNFKKERDAALLEIETLKTELRGRPDPQGFQQKISTLEGRIKELEPYELVFALHKNPAFKQKYIDGPNQIAAEMKQIAVDYGMEEDVVEQILMTDNRRELDETLEEYFSSTSARSDLKTLKQKYDGIIKERVEFEKKPREALTQFHSTQEQQDAQINQQRDAHLKTVIAEGWQAALQQAKQVSQNQKIYELLEQPGKKDHNEKVVKPTLGNAQAMLQTGVDYIERLVRSKAVPSKEFVQWFAQVCQQAAATQMVNHVRWGIHEKYQELLNQQKEQRGYDRPPVASQNRASPSKGKKKGKKTEEISAEIWQSVVSN